MYMIYLGVGAVLYFLVASMGTTGIGLFVILTGIILSFYGGGFATVPAYLKDLFGTAEVGAIHGRLLTAWSAAGVAGPLIVNGLADLQEGNGGEGADLYTLSLYIMVGVLAVGFLANLMIKPVDERHQEPEREPAAADEEPRFTRTVSRPDAGAHRQPPTTTRSGDARRAGNARARPPPPSSCGAWSPPGSPTAWSTRSRASSTSSQADVADRR